MKLVSSCNGQAKELGLDVQRQADRHGFPTDTAVTHLLSQLLQLSKQVLRHTRHQASLHDMKVCLSVSLSIW